MTKAKKTKVQVVPLITFLRVQKKRGSKGRYSSCAKEQLISSLSPSAKHLRLRFSLIGDFWKLFLSLTVFLSIIFIQSYAVRKQIFWQNSLTERIQIIQNMVSKYKIWTRVAAFLLKISNNQIWSVKRIHALRISIQKLNITPGNQSRWAHLAFFFQSWQSTQVQRDGLLFLQFYFSSLATQAVYFISISTNHWFENLRANIRQKWLAQMKCRVHPLSVSFRQNTIIQ